MRRVLVIALIALAPACRPGNSGKSTPPAVVGTASSPIEVGELTGLRSRMMSGRVIMAGAISWYAPHGWLFKDRRCAIELAPCAAVSFREGEDDATPGYIQLEDLVYSSAGIHGVRTTDTIVEVDFAFDPSRPAHFGPRIKLVRVVNPGKRLGDPM